MTRQLTKIDLRPPAGEPALEPTRYLVRGSIAPRFVDAHALSAADAIAFVPADERERRAVAAMLANGSLRQPVAGRFYLDYAAYRAAAEARRRRLLPWLVVIPILIAVVAIYFYQGR